MNNIRKYNKIPETQRLWVHFLVLITSHHSTTICGMPKIKPMYLLLFYLTSSDPFIHAHTIVLSAPHSHSHPHPHASRRRVSIVYHCVVGYL